MIHCKAPLSWLFAIVATLEVCCCVCDANCALSLLFCSVACDVETLQKLEHMLLCNSGNYYYCGALYHAKLHTIGKYIYTVSCTAAPISDTLLLQRAPLQQAQCCFITHFSVTRKAVTD
jgi:hypothetical protein